MSGGKRGWMESTVVLQTCAILDEKNAESERALEESMKEKKALENALATDHDTKVQVREREL